MNNKKLIDALNRLEQLARSRASELGEILGGDYDEGDELQVTKDYKVLFDFIKNTRNKAKKIKIPFSHSDIDELFGSPNGEVFDWTFDGVNTIIIKED